MINLKDQVGKRAVDFIEDGMIVGLGTGSTVYYLVEALAEKIKEEGISIQCVTTSIRTKEHAESLGIKISDLDEVPYIDLTIDGADEVDPDFNGIKGGGAAHLYEKIVASNSKRNIWIVDESKMVDQLGAFPLPVEVVKYGSGKLFNKLEKEGLNPSWRLDDEGNKLLTDDNNYVIDLNLGTITNIGPLASKLNAYTGIIEHGLFIGITDMVIVGYLDGPKVLTID
ncbi:MAG TPA: ribose-5-phosphate isomerase RpiA [Alloiococcus sp.]|nr:ribose-5-phosphate isomerase RpiA [Alloiococcus sp.]